MAEQRTKEIGVRKVLGANRFWFMAANVEKILCMLVVIALFIVYADRLLFYVSTGCSITAITHRYFVVDILHCNGSRRGHNYVING